MIGPNNSYSSLSCTTLVPESNTSYLYDLHYASKQVLDGSTMGLLMLLSSLQYQAPYMGPYSTAFGQAGKAAYIESGGQAMQDKASGVVSKDALGVAHNIGLTDQEMAVFLGTATIVRNRQIDVNGPKILSIKPHLTLSPNSVILGIKYGW